MSETRAVDIRRHIPWYYADIPAFDALSETENAEFHVLLEADAEGMADAFVVTAGEEGTTRRERELYIRADRASEDLAFRRKRIINRYTLKPPFTMRWLEGQLERLLGGVYSVERSADVRELHISVEARDWAVFREFLYTLEVTVPLNMGLRLTKRSEGELGLYLAAAHITRTHHTHALPRRGIPGAAPLRMGVAHFVRTVREHTTTSSIIHVSRAAAIPWHSGAAGAVYVSASAAEDE